MGEQAAGSESGSEWLGSIAVFNSGGAGGERLAARRSAVAERRRLATDSWPLTPGPLGGGSGWARLTAGRLERPGQSGAERPATQSAPLLGTCMPHAARATSSPRMSTAHSTHVSPASNQEKIGWLSTFCSSNVSFVSWVRGVGGSIRSFSTSRRTMESGRSVLESLIDCTGRLASLRISAMSSRRE